MSETNALKSVASNIRRIKLSRQSDRRGGRSRQGYQDLFEVRLTEHIKEGVSGEELRLEANIRADQDADPPDYVDEGDKSAAKMLRPSMTSYPVEIGSNTDISA